jgi:tetratricopeptide (TPR) repeat protein
MMPRLPCLASLALLLCLGVVASAWAVDEWYELYMTAKDRQIPRGQLNEAIRNLKAAVHLKPSSGLDQQTYGLQFTDYFPYYYLGLCHSRLGDSRTALSYFDKELSYGAVRGRQPVLRDLQQLRQEAQADLARAEMARQTQAAQGRVGEQLARSAELERERRYDEALTVLTEARKVAEVLDQPMQRQVLDRLNQVRSAKHDWEEAQARTRRIERSLSDARRMLEENRDQEALRVFDEVLALDPRNTTADAGRREAQRRILVYTTRQELEAARRTGKELLDSGRYEEAIAHLTKAAADPDDHEAKAYLDQAQRHLAAQQRQRDSASAVTRLMTEGKRLMAAGKYAAALVRFESVLETAPENTLARELAEAASSALARQRPNPPPVLSIVDPVADGAELLDRTVIIEGMAFDDRGLAKVEYFVDDQLIEEQLVPIGPKSGEPQQKLRIRREFPLAPGRNEIRVRVTDVLGAQSESRVAVSRRLPFYMKREFLPLAGTGAAALLGLTLVTQRLRRRRAFRARFNPYIAGAPVLDDHMFFGRQRLLSRVMNVLHHNSLMITGERRIGKTTLLCHLKKCLERDSGTEYRFFPVLTDLQGVPETGFFSTIMGDIVDNLGLTPETIGALRFRRSVEDYDGRDFSHDLQRVITELRGRTPLEVKLVLLVDEADMLNTYSERSNQLLRAIFMKTFAEHLVTVMSGVGVKRTWVSEGSPWYNFFEQIQLLELTREEAEALIRKPVQGTFRYDPDAVDAIIDRSQLKPYLIQKICIHAVNAIIEARRTNITRADVEAVVSEFHPDDGGHAVENPELAPPKDPGSVAH